MISQCVHSLSLSVGNHTTHTTFEQRCSVILFFFLWQFVSLFLMIVATFIVISPNIFISMDRSFRMLPTLNDERAYILLSCVTRIIHQLIWQMLFKRCWMPFVGVFYTQYTTHSIYQNRSSFVILPFNVALALDSVATYFFISNSFIHLTFYLRSHQTSCFPLEFILFSQYISVFIISVYVLDRRWVYIVPFSFCCYGLCTSDTEIRYSIEREKKKKKIDAVVCYSCYKQTHFHFEHISD